MGFSASPHPSEYCVDGLTKPHAVPTGQCTPFQIPSQYDDLSQLCDYLKELPERQVQEEYSKGRVTAPVNRGGRPPAGCLAGMTLLDMMHDLLAKCPALLESDNNVATP